MILVLNRFVSFKWVLNFGEMSWNPAVDPTLRLIQPVGLPLAVMSTSGVFVLLGLVFTTIRVHTRIVDHAFGLDDWFITIGCVSTAAKRSSHTFTKVCKVDGLSWT